MNFYGLFCTNWPSLMFLNCWIFRMYVYNVVLNRDLQRVSRTTVLTLAYQSLGVVYGDLSTSPLYVYRTTFSGKLSLYEDDEEIFGVLSFIFWTFTLIALFKYVFIVMLADDNGEGTVLLFSLWCCLMTMLSYPIDLMTQIIRLFIQPSSHFWMVGSALHSTILFSTLRKTLCWSPFSCHFLLFLISSNFPNDL